MALVAVDRGHGWGNKFLWLYDSGAVGLVVEAEITLLLASMINIKLNYDGIETFPIRVGGKETARLLWRGIQLANNKKCSRYVSVHVNSDIQKSGEGWELWIRKDDIHSKLLESRIYEQLNNTIKDKMSFRGIKETDVLQVCVKTQMPACLIELGFVNSEKDVELLKSISFLNQCARAIVNGIKDDLK